MVDGKVSVAEYLILGKEIYRALAKSQGRPLMFQLYDLKCALAVTSTDGKEVLCMEFKEGFFP